MYRVCWYVRTLIPPLCMYAQCTGILEVVYIVTHAHMNLQTQISTSCTQVHQNICCSYIRTHVCTYVRDLFKALFFSIKAILLCPEETTVRRYTSVSRTPQK